MPRWTELYWPDDDPRWREEDADPGFWPIFLNGLERSGGLIVLCMLAVLAVLATITTVVR